MRNIAIVLGLIVVLGIIGYFLSGSILFNKNTPLSEQKKVQSDGGGTELSKACDGELTPSLTEGPYYKAGSPERANIRGNSAGERLTVTGFVFDQNCEPIAGAWLDFWQADGNGNYDNEGYNLRGHQFTDSAGKYTLETIIPARYSGRTLHIHVKVRANDQSQIITSQLFFPGESQNQADSIFNDRLLVEIRDTENGKEASFNFVIPTS